jgi:hypothetical protein
VLFEADTAMGRDAVRAIMVEMGDPRPFSDVAGAARDSADQRACQAEKPRAATADRRLCGGHEWRGMVKGQHFTLGAQSDPDHARLI